MMNSKDSITRWNGSCEWDSWRDYKSNTISDVFCELLINSIPSWIGMFIAENVSNIKFIFIGHLRDVNEIAALGIAETMITLFYYIPVISNMTTIDTFVSASYGSKQFYQCGVFLNKTILILTVLSLPLIWAQLFIKHILLAFGQDPLIADLVQNYFYFRMPTLVFLWYLEVIRRYLYNLGCFKFTMITAAFELIIEAILWYLFIWYFKMDYIGTAIASGLTNIIVLWVIIALFKFTSLHEIPQECMHLFNKDSIKKWGDFFWYVLPTMFIALIECGIFSIMQICAGIIGIIELGSNSTIF